MEEDVSQDEEQQGDGEVESQNNEENSSSPSSNETVRQVQNSNEESQENQQFVTARSDPMTPQRNQIPSGPLHQIRIQRWSNNGLTPVNNPYRTLDDPRILGLAMQNIVHSDHFDIQDYRNGYYTRDEYLRRRRENHYNVIAIEQIAQLQQLNEVNMEEYGYRAMLSQRTAFTHHFSLLEEQMEWENIYEIDERQEREGGHSSEHFVQQRQRLIREFRTRMEEAQALRDQQERNGQLA